MTFSPKFIGVMEQVRRSLEECEEKITRLKKVVSDQRALYDRVTAHVEELENMTGQVSTVVIIISDLL